MACAPVFILVNFIGNGWRCIPRGHSKMEFCTSGRSYIAKQNPYLNYLKDFVLITIL